MLLVSGVQQSDSVIHTFILFSDSSPIWVITEYRAEFPVLYSRALLVICFKYSSVSVSAPGAQPALPHPSSSVSVGPFYFCFVNKLVCIIL